jgi:hypothetical protein
LAAARDLKQQCFFQLSAGFQPVIPKENRGFKSGATWTREYGIAPDGALRCGRITTPISNFCQSGYQCAQEICLEYIARPGRLLRFGYAVSAGANRALSGRRDFKPGKRSHRSGGRVGFMRRLIGAVISVLVLALFLTACSGQPLSTREKGTLGGGILGAGTGALIGAAVGHPAAGAAIGGAIGGVGGYAVGNSMQNQEVQQQQTQSQIEQQQQEIERQRRELEQMRQQQQTE